MGDFEACSREMIADRLAAGVGLGRAGVTDGDDRTNDAVGGRGPVFGGDLAHAVLSGTTKEKGEYR